jgi:hypothetical protein
MPIQAAVTMVLTFGFGVVPATYLVFWAVIFGLGAIVVLIAPPLETGSSQIVAWKVALMLLATASAVLGYAALLRAASGTKTPRVAIGLTLGIAANAYGIFLMFDINAYAMRQWSTWFWFISPIVVGLVHLVSYVVRAGHPSTPP